MPSSGISYIILQYNNDIFAIYERNVIFFKLEVVLPRKRLCILNRPSTFVSKCKSDHVLISCDEIHSRNKVNLFFILSLIVAFSFEFMINFVLGKKITEKETDRFITERRNAIVV